MNSKNLCYCNPSTEDCSCSLGINPYNQTVGLEDIKCYDDIKMSRSLYTEDILNVSRTIKIIEFDNFKYNINHLPTNEYRIEAVKSVFLLSLAYETEPNKEEAFVQDQSSVKTNLPVSVILRQQLNIKKSKNKSLAITSCIKTGNTLVFTDFYNYRLIICNSDGTDIHHISLSYTPYYMTVVNSNTVAVSCTPDKTILIINISTGSVTSTINIRGDCYGISYNDNNLYVVIGRSIIHVMDLTGKVIRTIPLPSHRIFDITVDRNRLVCIDETSIYNCSFYGTPIWKFKKDTFKDLRRVTTDNEGNVYVANYNTNTVVVVSDDGQHHKEILTKSDGLNKSWGIYFDKKDKILLVSNDFDASMFDVRKNENKHE
ncbi:uncharacterized protein LOC127703885 [Mytilus californianus]|uniref:uncharacterized protein LOC127703885 n=1 Tax=Mytilus californianus TaxID=6549 RepID=UPI0022476234|nr:uncharacterized protein LOC127703885 [Mytilus californianus]